MGIQTLSAVLNSKPSATRILCCAIVAGLTTAVIAIYIFILLGFVIMVMDDDKYEEQRDNYTKNQVMAAFGCGFFLSLSSVALFSSVLRLYVSV
jgi:NADH:ubiquinone oxidoreductase subunit 6 (subunit J)